MEYPESTFTKLWRKVLFIGFILLFLTVSPIVVAYTVGYRYDWQRGLLKETGAIGIDILPKNTTVYINDQKIKDSIPIRLNTVTPSTYILHITAPNYYDWYKEIEVKNKQTVYIKEIQLIKKNKPIKITDTDSRYLSLSPDKKYLISLTNEKNKTEVHLLNLENNQNTTLLTLPLGESRKVLWSSQSQKVILEDEGHSENPVIFNSLSTSNLSQIESESISKEKIKKIQWAETNENIVYFSTSSENIVAFDLTQKTIITNLTIPHQDWYVQGDTLFTLSKNTSTRWLELEKTPVYSPQKKEIVTLPSETFNTNSSSSQDWKIEKIFEGTVLLGNIKQKESYLITKEGTRFNLQTKNSLISEYNNWWLFWNNWELWSYSKNENPNLLIRSGENLQSVLPLDIYNTLLLVWDKKTSIFFPYYRVTHDFLTEAIQEVVVDPQNQTLYFTKTSEKGLWKLIY